MNTIACLLDPGVPEVPFQLSHAKASLCNRSAGEYTSTLATAVYARFGHAHVRKSPGSNPPPDILALTTAQAIWEAFPASTDRSWAARNSLC